MPGLAELSERELEVAKLLHTGKSPAEIGRALGVSPKTVKVHKQNIYRKLEIHTISELVLMVERAK